MTGALVVIVAWLAWLQWGQPPRDTLYWNTLFDAGHALGFAVSTWALERVLRWWKPRLSSGRRAGTAAFLACVLAVLTELVQFADPRREPSVGDVLRDLAGIGGYLAWQAAAAPGRARITRAGFASIVAALLAFACWPWVEALNAYRGRDTAMPVVVDPGARWQEVFLTRNLVTLERPDRPDAEAITLRLAPGRYPGIAVDEISPDWRGFERLRLRIDVTGTAPLDLVLRLHDSRHDGTEADRFNRTLRLHPGWQTIEIAVRDVAAAPNGRALDLADMRGMALFAPALSAPAVVRVTPLRLE